MVKKQPANKNPTIKNQQLIEISSWYKQGVRKVGGDKAHKFAQGQDDGTSLFGNFLQLLEMCKLEKKNGQTCFQAPTEQRNHPFLIV